MTLSLANSPVISPGKPPVKNYYGAPSAVFDGSTNRVKSTSPGTSLNGPFYFATWFRVLDNAPVRGTLFSANYTDGSSTEAVIDIGVMGIGAVRASIANVFQDELIITPDAYNDGKYHFLEVSSQNAAGGFRVQLDGDPSTLQTEDGINLSTGPDNLINMSVGAYTNLSDVGSLYFDGEIAETYFSHRNTLIAGVDTGKFIQNGKPVFLGADGSNPDGFQPSLYLNQAVPNFESNQGFGTNFVEVGTLTAGNTPCLG